MAGKKRVRGWVVAVLDILLIGVGLCVFAYFHHVRPQILDVEPQVIARVTPTPVAATPTPGDIGNQTGEETPQPDDSLGGGKFAFMFLEEGAQSELTETSYKSHDVSITIEKVADGTHTYYVADIYVRTIDNFKTAFAGGKYGKNINDTIKTIASENNAILAINGDYYGAHTRGVVIRNGELYRNPSGDADVCVLYSDGTMETCTADEFNIADAVSRGAYQAWSFGPQLMKDGAAITDFSNSNIKVENPRTGIGYYESGHYCFIVIDGRQTGYAVGMTLTEMAKVFADLGCKYAYNLDGGQTSAMVFNGEFADQPYKGGRDMSDIIYIGEVE